jgi:hypothetical protein
MSTGELVNNAEWWSNNEPNDLYNEDCVIILLYNGKWDDVKCYTKSHFVCEKIDDFIPNDLPLEAKFAILESKGCLVPQWVSDGTCDDITNTPECDYDGDDCCLDEIDTEYCTDCLCKMYWTEFEGLILHANLNNIKMSDAYDHCTSIGGKLAEPTCWLMNEKISVFAGHNMAKYDKIWIGINDIETEGT